MKNIVQGKRLLILSGANQHLKIVEAAKELGIYTIVADYLKDSPAKKICDKSYLYNVKDIDAIVDMCKQESVDGIITSHIDPCQMPYNDICEKLSLPCLGTHNQFFCFTNKHAFKQLCIENNVEVIPEYSEEDVETNLIEYPIFVKPVDSRGSRGQTVCFSKEELVNGIKLAKLESSNGEIIIEQYMGGFDEFQVTYFFINEEAYLIRTADSYRGSVTNKMNKVVNCSISPSRYTNLYFQNAHPNILKMLKNMGMKNGPLFMQGFHNKGHFYFFDPGLRFPGVEYERIYKRVYNIDLMQLLINFALTGFFTETCLPDNSVGLNGHYAAILFPTLKKGRIKKIEGVSEIQKDRHIISYLTKYKEGDAIDWTYDVNQRYAEIDMLTKDINELSKTIENIQNALVVKDEYDTDMLFDKFDIKVISNNYK